MGVKDLNVLIKKFPPVHNKKFDVAIIDGTNLLIIILSRVKKILSQTFPLNLWKGISLNVVQQYKYILENSVAQIDTFIESVKRDYNTEKIIIVCDPVNTVSYEINDKMDFNAKYKNVFFENAPVTNLFVKREEQTKRVNQSLQSNQCDKEVQNLVNLGLSEVLIDIYKQSFYFCIPHNLNKIIHSLVYELSKKYSIISAIDEADLVIKNLAMTEVENKKSVIVFSRDTDYFILFSDCPDVYVSPFGFVYNPYFIWSTFLGNAYNFDLIIRIAPLAGNDYSQAGIILLSSSVDMILHLCNVNDKINLIKNEKRKKIKCLNSIEVKPGEITAPEQIDDAVNKYDPEYFKRYFSSVIIYKNWKHFNKFSIYEKKEPIPITKIITFTKIYNWNNNLIFKWDEFFKEVTETENLDEEYNNYKTLFSYDVSAFMTFDE
jgi:hypothetical protein